MDGSLAFCPTPAPALQVAPSVSPEALSAGQLVAAITGMDESDAIEAMKNAGGVEALLGLSPRAPLARTPFKLACAVELVQRAQKATFLAGTTLTSPADCTKFLRTRLAHRPYEVAAFVFLDNRNRVLDYREMFRGTIDGAQVPVREVVIEALKHNAASIIMAHCHPSGIAVASAADRGITRQIKDALNMVGMRLLDHFLIAGDEAVSFAAKGWI